jgi:GNAT superfamily N-acetyltransferase
MSRMLSPKSVCTPYAGLVTVAVVPELVIRSLDPTVEADMDGFQDVYAAAELAEDPKAALYSRADGIAMLSSDDPGSLFEAFGGFVDGRMVAETILSGSNRDNLETAQSMLWVDPAHRGQGFGSRMLEHLAQHAFSARGRRVLHAQARIGGPFERNRRFVERHGFALMMTEVERRLSFPIDLALVDRLAAEAAPHHRDYEIQGFVGSVPAELRASYVDVRNLLGVEAPHGDMQVEPGRDTVADFDAVERERIEAGRTAVTALAVRDGKVVAYADASVPGHGARHVDQYGTLVHPDHRGRRLGMAVKCAQLRLLAEHFPDRDYLQTSNAEVNEHMVAINVALGFEIYQVWGEFEKRLA